MPAAAAEAKPDAPDTAAAPTPSRFAALKALKGKNKLLLMIGAALLLLVLAGSGATWYLLTQRAAAEAETAAAADGDDDAAAEQHAEKEKARAARKGPPTFVPLDPFTVNLADREAERYAQVGITLELEDAKDTETVKQYMPAIRNNILLVLAQKSSAELLGRDGKLRLAEEVRLEALRALGVDANDAVHPVRAVQFSNFIVQ